MSLALLEGIAPLTRAHRRLPAVSGELPDEDRLVIGGISWEEYLAIDEERGADNSRPRLYYLDGEIEIMTTSLRHERIKCFIALLLGQDVDALELEFYPHGQTTLLRVKEAGAEPDESWCFHTEKEIPDLVFEVALTSGGLNKLETYRHFAIPEVWFWRRDALEAWTLRADANGYDGPAQASRVLPGLDLSLLARCVVLPTWSEARRAFRAGLKPGA